MSVPTQVRRGLIAAAVIVAMLLALAFAAGPKSCEGGLELYFWSGIAALAALFVVPIWTYGDKTPAARFGWACAFLLAGVAAWVAGFAAADFKLMCRLF